MVLPMQITCLSVVFLLGATQSFPEESEASALLQLNTEMHENKAHLLLMTHLLTQESKHQTIAAEAAFKQMRVLMRPEEIHFFRQELSKADAYLEFGVGGSTAMASTFPNLHCYKGIDSSQEWIEIVSKEETVAKAIEQGIAELKHVDIGKIGKLGYPADNTTFALWPKYSDEGFGKCHAQAKHRMVLLDGRFRVACFLKLLLAMDQESASKTSILIHNYDWPEYHVIEEFADLIEIRGRLALLKKKPNADQKALKEVALKFEHEPL